MSAGGIRAGKAFVELGIKPALDAGLRSAQAKLQSFAGGVASFAAPLVAAGAAILAPIGLAANRFADAGDQVHKMAKRTGLAAAAASGWNYHLSQSGATAEHLEAGLRGMSNNLAAAAKGSANAQQKFADLGVSWHDLANQSPEQQLKTIADATKELKNPTQRAATLMGLMGEAGTKLIPALEGGADAIDASMAKAQRFGLILDQEAADAAAGLTDANDNLSQSLDALTQNIGSAVAPILTKLNNTIANLVGQTTQWISENKQLVVTVAAVGAGLVVAGGVLLGVAGAATVAAFALGALASGISAVGAMVAFLASPLGIVIGLAVAAGGALIYFSGLGTYAANALVGAFQYFQTTVLPILNAVLQALQSGEFALAGELLWKGLRLVFADGMAKILKDLQLWQQTVTQFFRGMANAFGKLPFGKTLANAIRVGATVADAGFDATLGKFQQEAKDLREELGGLKNDAQIAFDAMEAARFDTGAVDIPAFEIPELSGLADQMAKSDPFSAVAGTFSGSSINQIDVQARPLEQIVDGIDETNELLQTIIAQNVQLDTNPLTFTA